MPCWHQSGRSSALGGAAAEPVLLPGWRQRQQTWQNRDLRPSFAQLLCFRGQSGSCPARARGIEAANRRCSLGSHAPWHWRCVQHNLSATLPSMLRASSLVPFFGSTGRPLWMRINAINSTMNKEHTSTTMSSWAALTKPSSNLSVELLHSCVCTAGQQYYQASCTVVQHGAPSVLYCLGKIAAAAPYRSDYQEFASGTIERGTSLYTAGIVKS